MNLFPDVQKIIFLLEKKTVVHVLFPDVHKIIFLVEENVLRKFN